MKFEDFVFKFNEGFLFLKSKISAMVARLHDLLLTHFGPRKKCKRSF